MTSTPYVYVYVSAPPPLTHLGLRVLGAVVEAAIVVDDYLAILVIETSGGNQLPATAVLRELIAGKESLIIV